MVNFERAAAQGMMKMPKALLNKMAGEPTQIDGRTLDLQMQAFATMALKRAGDEANDITVPAMRETFDQMVTATQQTPAKVAVHDRTIPGAAGELPIRIYRPMQANASMPAIVWYHQGGFVIGGLDTDHAVCTLIADVCGAVVVSVDYRLAPEHAFPASIDDGITAYEWVHANAEGLGIDASRIGVAGTSAGANLSAVVCQEMRSRGGPQPFLQVLVYGMFDGTFEEGSRVSMADAFPLSADVLEFFSAQYLPDSSAANDTRVSPRLSGELWGLAPAVIVSAGFDPLRDDSEHYAKALSEAGVRVQFHCEDELTHSFTVFGGISKRAKKATDHLVSVIRDELHR
jgi:acetyl esterase/lipase